MDLYCPENLTKESVWDLLINHSFSHNSTYFVMLTVFCVQNLDNGTALK